MTMRMICLLGLASVSVVAVAKEPPAKPTSMLGKGYLAEPAPADSVLLSPPPPTAGSAAEARDLEGAKAAIALRGTARWDLATRDADIFTAKGTSMLSCAAGIAIGPETTPKLNALLRKTLADLGISTSVIKRKYQRARPFMVNGEPNCTPGMDAVLRKDGSYPSGHSAVGYGWGLILAELIPERASQIVARGRAFGDSRRICNVHWLSDTEEGRIAAAANVARLHADPVFMKDMKAVRAELKKVKAPPQDCEKEAAALAVGN